MKKDKNEKNKDEQEEEKKLKRSEDLFNKKEERYHEQVDDI